MTAPLVALDAVTVSYGGVPALDAVDLHVAAGELVGVVGPSGSGKTTLLRAVLGSVAPTHGVVRLAPGARVGYVAQVGTVDWTFPLTVLECVLVARRGRRLPRVTSGERAAVAAVLDRLGLGGLEGRHIGALSGGQQQRVLVARALVGEPDLLLLDEPTAGLDVRTRHEVLHLLADLHADGLTVLLTTHDLNGTAAHLPRVVCLNRGVLGDGAPVDVITPEVLERTYGAPLDVLVHGGMPVVVDLSPHGALPLDRAG